MHMQSEPNKHGSICGGLNCRRRTVLVLLPERFLVNTIPMCVCQVIITALRAPRAKQLICYVLIFFTKAHSVALCRTITKTYYLQVKGFECSSLQIIVRVKMKPVQQACKIKLAYSWSQYEHLLKKHGSALLCIWS